jgi:hypothetical protein
VQKNGMMGYLTISFDIRSEYGHTSYVKFGGFDVFALKNGKVDDLKLFPTLSIDEWTVALSELKDTNGSPFP